MANDFQPNTTGAPSQAQTLLGGLIQGFGNGVESSLQRDIQLKALQQYREQMLGQKGEKQRYQELLDQARTELANKQAGKVSAQTDVIPGNAQASNQLKNSQAGLADARTVNLKNTPVKGSDPKSFATAQSSAHKQAVAQAGLDPHGDMLSQVTSNTAKGDAYNQAYQNYMKQATGKDVPPVFDIGQTPGKYWGMNAQVKIHPGSESVLSGGGSPAPAAAGSAPAAKPGLDDIFGQ